MDSYELGLEVIEQFYIHSQRLYPQTFTLSWDDFLEEVISRGDFISDIGDKILEDQISSHVVDIQMSRLAMISEGGIPNNSIVYLDALLGREADFKIELPDMASKVASNIVGNQMGGLQEVGVKAISMIKDNYKMILMLSVLVGGSYVAYKKGYVSKLRNLIS